MEGMRERINDLASELGVTFAFVPIGESSYRIATQKIKRLVEEASKELLILDYVPLGDIEGTVRFHRPEDKASDERREYYAEITEKILNSTTGTFRYRRILQVPQTRRVADMLTGDSIFRTHCEALVKIGEKQPEIASLKACAPFYEGSYIILDRKCLILEMNMLDPRMAIMLVQAISFSMTHPGNW